MLVQEHDKLELEHDKLELGHDKLELEHDKLELEHDKQDPEHDMRVLERQKLQLVHDRQEHGMQQYDTCYQLGLLQEHELQQLVSELHIHDHALTGELHHAGLTGGGFGHSY